jgi:hypothetical protein
MTQLGIYESAVPLTPGRHAKHCVQIGADYRFGAKLISAPLVAAEFPEASAEYAIVFAGPPEGIMPVVVLGLRQGENLFVGSDSSWRARYKPAFVRQYPFVFAPDKGGEGMLLCIDEAFSGLNRDGKGNRLFGDDGKPTAYVDGMLKFLGEYQRQFQRTREFCRQLQELGLLSGIEATVALSGGGNASLKGMQGIDRAKLKALPADTVAELMRRDALELVYLHLNSMRNLGTLRDRLASARPPANGRAEGGSNSV